MVTTMGPALRSAPLVVDCLQRARWRCRETLSRKAGAEAAERLLGSAAEMAESPDGRDQLMSLALVLGAEDILAGASPLETFPDIALGRVDDMLGPDSCEIGDSEETRQEADRLAASICDEAAQACENPQERRERLLALAELQGLLWRSPLIPASLGTRRIMRASAALILRRVV